MAERTSDRPTMPAPLSAPPGKRPSRREMDATVPAMELPKKAPPRVTEVNPRREDPRSK